MFNSVRSSQRPFLAPTLPRFRFLADWKYYLVGISTSICLTFLSIALGQMLVRLGWPEGRTLESWIAARIKHLPVSTTCHQAPDWLRNIPS